MVSFFPFLDVQKLAEEAQRKSRLWPSVNMDAVRSFFARFKKNRV
jgi:hypothetical protein